MQPPGSCNPDGARARQVDGTAEETAEGAGCGRTTSASAPSTRAPACRGCTAPRTCCAATPPEADDIVQATAVALYLHWRRVRAADNIEGYVRRVLVRP